MRRYPVRQHNRRRTKRFDNPALPDGRSECYIASEGIGGPVLKHKGLSAHCVATHETLSLCADMAQFRYDVPATP